MARLGNRGMVLEASANGGDWLINKISKAALCDLYCQSLALQNGHADSAVSMAELLEDADPVLRARNDRTLESCRKADIRKGFKVPE